MAFLRTPKSIWVRWITFLLSVTVGLVAINLIWLVPTIRRIRSSASLFALEIVDRVRSNITIELDRAVKDLSVAGDDIVSDPGRIREILGGLFRNNESLIRVALVERTGREIRAFEQKFKKGEEIFSDRDYSKTPYFYTALQGAPNFGDVFLSPELDPHVNLVVPVLHAGKSVEHVLVAELNLRNFVAAARNLQITPGHIYVVDDAGIQIVHPDVKEIVKRRNFLARPIIQKVIIEGRVADGLASEDFDKNQEGEWVFTVGVPIPVAKLGLFLEQPLRSAFAFERQMLLVAGLTSGLGLFIFFIILQGNIRLGSVNRRLQEFLEELDDTGKMLVRRDLELTRANIRLVELDVIKSEFVSVAAHQLRTPLTGIKWALAALLEEDSGKLVTAQKKVVRDAFDATNRLTELINDLLNVARLEEGRFGFNFKKQPVMPIFEHVGEILKKNAAEKGVEIIWNVPAIDEALWFNLDEEKIAIAFDNVFDNALKYTLPGGKVTVTVKKEKSNMTIEIQDTGIGIPDEQLHRVFSKFFRAQNAQLYQTSGTGLGLYVTKNIIEQHDGMITCTSVENKGTTFKITLPIL